MLWRGGSVLYTSYGFPAIAASPVSRTLAPLVVPTLFLATADSSMATTGLSSAPVKVAAAKSSIFRSPTFGALHGQMNRSCLHPFSRCHCLGCGGTVTDSDLNRKRFRCTDFLPCVSTGLRGRHREPEAAIPISALRSSCSAVAADASASTQAPHLHSTTLEAREEGTPSTATGSDVTKRWRHHAAQCASTSQCTTGAPQQGAGPNAASSSERQSLAPTSLCDGLPGPRSSRNTTDDLLQAASSSVAAPPGNSEGAQAALAPTSGKLVPVSSTRVIRAAAAAADGTPCIEGGAEVSTGGTLPSRPTEKDSELRTAAGATAPVHSGVQQRGGGTRILLRAPSNSCFSRLSTTSCTLRFTRGLIGRNISSFGAAVSRARGKGVVAHGIACTKRDQSPSWDSRCWASSWPLAALSTITFPDGSTVNATCAAAAERGSTWRSAPSCHPTADAAWPPIAAGSDAPTRARETGTSTFRAGVSAQQKEDTSYTGVKAAATEPGVKILRASPVSFSLQWRWAASDFRLHPRKTVARLCSSQPQPSTHLLGEWVKGHCSASLFRTRHDLRHTEAFVMYEQQRCNSGGKALYITVSSVSRRTEAPVLKREMTHAPCVMQHFLSSVRTRGKGNGSTAVAAAVATIQGVPRPPDGPVGAPTSAATAVAAACASTDIVSPTVSASEQNWHHGGLGRPHRTVTRLYHVFIPVGTTRVELESAIRCRDYSTAARGLELCGSISSGASVDTSISASAATSTGAIAAAAAAGQQRLSSQRKLLSFDASTVKIPHPSKRDKGGEDASACSPRLLVVADGVGGWGMSGVDAGLYSRELVQRLGEVFEECCEEKHAQQQQKDHHSSGSESTTQGSGDAGSQNSLGRNTRGNVLSERTPDPVQLLKAAYLTTRAIGSSTCCLVVLDRLQNRVRCANIGDSGFILYRPSKDTIVARSNFQSHDFNFPLQLGTGSSDMPEHAHVMELPVQEGDIFLLATDGVWDNLYDEQVLEVFRRGLDVQAAAEELSRLAFKCSQDPSWNSPFATKEKEALGLPGRHAGGKPDDITVVVAILKGDANDRIETSS